MLANDLFEEKQHLVFAAIKQQFGSMTRAAKIAELNNMELDDLIQFGRMYLWERCLKHDPERIETFSAYVMRGMKWAMSDELHLKGSLFKISRRISHEERNKINIHSIDYHQEEEEVHGFYAVSPIDVEEEVTKHIEFEEVTSVLEEKKSPSLCTLVKGIPQKKLL